MSSVLEENINLTTANKPATAKKWRVNFVLAASSMSLEMSTVKTAKLVKCRLKLMFSPPVAYFALLANISSRQLQVVKTVRPVNTRVQTLLVLFHAASVWKENIFTTNTPIANHVQLDIIKIQMKKTRQRAKLAAREMDL